MAKDLLFSNIYCPPKSKDVLISECLDCYSQDHNCERGAKVFKDFGNMKKTKNQEIKEGENLSKPKGRPADKGAIRCSVEGCNRVAVRKGVCRAHYENHEKKTCLHPGCKSTLILGRGLCGKHYYQARKKEGTLGEKIGQKKKIKKEKNPHEKYWLIPDNIEPISENELLSYDLKNHKIIKGNEVKVSIKIEQV